MNRKICLPVDTIWPAPYHSYKRNSVGEIVQPLSWNGATFICIRTTCTCQQQSGYQTTLYITLEMSNMMLMCSHLSGLDMQITHLNIHAGWLIDWLFICFSSRSPPIGSFNVETGFFQVVVRFWNCFYHKLYSLGVFQDLSCMVQNSSSIFYRI